MYQKYRYIFAEYNQLYHKLYIFRKLDFLRNLNSKFKIIIILLLYFKNINKINHHKRRLHFKDNTKCLEILQKYSYL